MGASITTTLDLKKNFGSPQDKDSLNMVILLSESTSVEEDSSDGSIWFSCLKSVPKLCV